MGIVNRSSVSDHVFISFGYWLLLFTFVKMPVMMLGLKKYLILFNGLNYPYTADSMIDKGELLRGRHMLAVILGDIDSATKSIYYIDIFSFL